MNATAYFDRLTYAEWAMMKAAWLAGTFCYLIVGNALLGGPKVRCGCSRHP